MWFSVACFDIRVSVMYFTFCLFMILLVRFWLLSDQLFLNSCPLSRPFFLIVFCLFVFFIANFGFKSGIWLLIAPVLVHYFSFTFILCFNLHDVIKTGVGAKVLEFMRRLLSLSHHESWKSIFIFYIYTLFSNCLSVLFVKIQRNKAKHMAQKGYLSTCLAMTFNSRRHDVTSIEHYVDQS